MNSCRRGRNPMGRGRRLREDLFAVIRGYASNTRCPYRPCPANRNPLHSQLPHVAAGVITRSSTRSRACQCATPRFPWRSDARAPRRLVSSCQYLYPYRFRPLPIGLGRSLSLQADPYRSRPHAASVASSLTRSERAALCMIGLRPLLQFVRGFISLLTHNDFPCLLAARHSYVTPRTHVH